MKKYSHLNWIILLLFILIPLWQCTKKEVVRSTDLEEFILPTYKDERDIAISVSLNYTDENELDYIQTDMPQYIIEQLQRSLKTIRITEEYRIIDNADELQKNRDEVMENNIAKAEEVYAELEEDYLEYVPPVEEEEQEETYVNPLLDEPDTEEGQPPQDFEDEEETESDTDQVNEEGAVSLNELLVGSVEIENPSYYTQEKIEEYEEFTATLDPLFGINIEEFYSVKTLTVQANIQQELFANESLARMKKEDFETVTNLGAVADSADHDIYFITYFTINESDTEVIDFHIHSIERSTHTQLFEPIVMSFSREEITQSIRYVGGEISRKITEAMLHNIPTGELVIKTNVENAIVYIDGQYVEDTREVEGITGAVINYIPFGFHKLELIEYGYEKLSTEIFIEPDQRHILNYDLVPIQTSGCLKIYSYPPGANCWVDLDYVGTTKTLPMDNYLDLGFTITAGITFSLAGLPFITPSIGFEENLLNHAMAINLPPGYHRIKLQQEGYNPFMTRVKMEEDTIVSVYYELQPATEDWDDPQLRSKNYNLLKNAFLYSTIVSLLGYIGFMYKYQLDLDKYEDTLYAYGEGGNVDLQIDFNYFRVKEMETRAVSNASIVLTALLAVMTITFQWLELDAMDLEIGQTIQGDYYYDFLNNTIGMGIRF